MRYGQVQFKTLEIGALFEIRSHSRRFRTYRKTAFNGGHNAEPTARGDFPKFFSGSTWVYPKGD